MNVLKCNTYLLRILKMSFSSFAVWNYFYAFIPQNCIRHFLSNKTKEVIRIIKKIFEICFIIYKFLSRYFNIRLNIIIKKIWAHLHIIPYHPASTFEVCNSCVDSRCKIAFFSATTKGHPLEAVGGLSDFFFVKSSTHIVHTFFIKC